eukprot:scaffold801_cov170-Amphora_coffeaeformis.AAC.3
MNTRIACAKLGLAAACFASLQPTCDGFTTLQTPHRHGWTISKTTMHDFHAPTTWSKGRARMSNLAATTTTPNGNDKLDEALQNDDLRTAVKVLQEYPDVELNRSRWNAIFSVIEETTANAEENTENLRQAAEFPMESEARSSMTAAYDALKTSGHLRLYGAVDTKMPLAAGSKNLPPALLESILEIPMKSLTPKPTNTLLIAGVVLALLEGVISSALGISLNFLAFATLLAFLADRLFVNGALSESLLGLFQPGMKAKVLKHEAGHFLAAYLLGCPVEGIVLSAWAALQDQRFASRQVSAGLSFFDPDLSQQINSNGKLTRSALDRYSIIVMAGIAAEAEQYGQADGGAGDEMSLVAFLSRLNGGKVGTWTLDTIRNQARWGALQAVLMMREYKPAYDALVDALERGGTLGECIYAIEKAARDNNLTPLKEPLGYIEGDKWTTEIPASLKESQPVSTASLELGKPRSESFDEEASLSSLSQYRTEVEKRLQDVERRLKELDADQQ